MTTENTTTTTEPKAKKASKPKAKPAPAKNENKLRKPQAAILGVLAKAKGPMTRQAISDRAGYSSSVGVYAEIGWPDAKKRAKADKAHPCLITLGWVREHDLDVDGRKELGIEITAAGRKALEKSKA